ncbi:hypothetical protein ABZ924_11695 [Streptomyces sp. NPDC046876]|uniref:hypothetical protein n=1 Tax=Streptomyces sp. NPDC046876 TaxID=3155616 RepID=UPI0033D6B642
MSFHPHHRPRPRPRSCRHRGPQGRTRRFVLAALTLLAFTAALIGCLHHTGAPSTSPAAAAAAAYGAPAHDHQPHPHHPWFTGDSRDVPEHDESCIPDYPSRTVQESSAPRPASVPVLFAVVLGLFGARLPVPGRRRGSPFPVRAREGRTVQATVCCWRI